MVRSEMHSEEEEKVESRIKTFFKNKSKSAAIPFIDVKSLEEK
jgi:hypothetical protein